ncbi:globulin-1 S allele-like [Iris pallida]|uniref:Globulin-1 S allele-like n=1 Tax=Iris pallida TaxID=29817 RepID=A0AAX6HZL3_IRIPA|nr:globulin-1 S allele-like [Iris pallida]
MLGISSKKRQWLPNRLLPFSCCPSSSSQPAWSSPLAERMSGTRATLTCSSGSCGGGVCFGACLKNKNKKEENNKKKKKKKKINLKMSTLKYQNWGGVLPACVVGGVESFVHRVRTQQGSIRVLRNFLQKSSLLMGIANYRLAMFEANPRTFAVPKQSDAEQIFFVTQGEGTVTLLRNEESRNNIRRESHNIRKGDIIRVHAGTVFYIINNSNDQKLQIVKLVQPVSTPGQFEDFYIGGGDKPESIYRTFSTRILEAALNTQQEKLERLFGQQKEGEIIQASEEQIRGMSGQPSTEGRQPFNLLQKRPDHSNERGQLYIANFEDYEELRDLDVHVTFTNIVRGSMMTPFYESKATEIMMILDGRGEFEMVSPYLSSQNQSSQCRRGQWGEESEEEEEGRCRYQKVKSSLTQGTVFIIPAGHPTAIIASEEQNLQVVCFKVHAKNSRKVFLTGRNNVVNQMEKEAKELSFGVPSKLVENVFGGSKDEVFVRGPGQSRYRRPFLEFAGF